MKDLFQKIIDDQQLIIRNWVNVDILSKQETQKAALEYIACIGEELAELRMEFPLRKFWHKEITKKFNNKKALEEFVDILIFMSALSIVMDWSPAKIQRAYENKKKLNQKRFL